MRIAIDTTALLPKMTGVDTYLVQLVFHLAKVDSRNEYLILHNREDRRVFTGKLPPRFHLLPISARPRPVRLFSQQIAMPAAAALWNAEVVHSPSFIMPYLRGSATHVLTIHDMTSFSHPECHIRLRRSELYKRMLLASLRRADLVIVPSQSTREAILSVLPDFRAERIHVTVPGIGEDFRLFDHTFVQNVVARLTLPQPYILYVGTLEPRKNLPTLVESYRRLVESRAIKEHLVLAGKLGWGYQSLLRQIRVPSLRGKVHLAGYLDQEHLPAVYAGARLFVYPSLYEGFGFPPLEAMACGVPVISTKSSSLLENLKDAAELVEPNDINGLADAMRSLLTDDDRRAALRAQGLERASRYRWEHTARETMKAYHVAARMRKGNG